MNKIINRQNSKDEIKKNKYQCSCCNNIYDKGWSDEESEAEMKDLWGNLPKKERAVVCDDCFQKIHPEKNKELAKKHGFKQ